MTTPLICIVTLLSSALLTGCAVTLAPGTAIGPVGSGELAVVDLSAGDLREGLLPVATAGESPAAELRPFTSPLQIAQTGWRPTASITAAFGPSNFRFKEAGGVNGSENAVSGRLRAEGFFGRSPVGPAMHASWTRSGDLFEGQMRNDGVSNQSATARATHIDAFPHAVIRAVRSRRFDLMIRAGASIDVLDMDYEASTLDNGYLSIGPKVVVEPELFLFNSRRSAFSWYSSVGYGYSWTAVSEQTATRDETYSSTAQFFEAETGLRFRAGMVRGSVGFVYSFADVDSTDAKNSIALPGAEYTRKMLMLEFGVDF